MPRRLDHDQLVAADAGMPVGERARRRGIDRDGSRRASSTTKSLPSPCILKKAILRMAPLIWRPGGACPTPARPALECSAGSGRPRRLAAAPGVRCALPPWVLLPEPCCLGLAGATRLPRLALLPARAVRAAALPHRCPRSCATCPYRRRLAARQPRPLASGMHRLMPREPVRRDGARRSVGAGAARTGAPPGDAVWRRRRCRGTARSRC